MPLLEVTQIKKLIATVSLEESTAKQVDQYAAFIKAPADEVVNSALEYVFGKTETSRYSVPRTPVPRHLGHCGCESQSMPRQEKSGAANPLILR